MSAFEKLGDQARHAIVVAADTGRDLGLKELDGKCLLMGSLSEDNNDACSILAEQSIVVADVYETVLATITRGEMHPADVQLPWTKDFKSALTLAEIVRDQQRELGSPAHILYGLISTKGPAKDVLLGFGLTAIIVRRAIYVRSLPPF